MARLFCAEAVARIVSGQPDFGSYEMFPRLHEAGELNLLRFKSLSECSRSVAKYAATLNQDDMYEFNGKSWTVCHRLGTIFKKVIESYRSIPRDPGRGRGRGNL